MNDLTLNYQSDFSTILKRQRNWNGRLTADILQKKLEELAEMADKDKNFFI